MMLTKEKILSGKDYREKVYIKSLDGEVMIRPLTQVEYARVEGLLAEGTKVSVRGRGKDLDASDANVEVNVGEITLKEHEAQRLVVSLCLVDETVWTAEEVGQITPANAVKEIADEVYRISGVRPSGKRLVEDFRKDKAGASDTDALANSSTKE